MKVLRIIAILLIILFLTGCRHGDFKASMVIEGQPAPFAGYNVGPELYVEKGDPVPVSGALISIEGLDPNDF